MLVMMTVISSSISVLRVEIIPTSMNWFLYRIYLDFSKHLLNLICDYLDNAS